MRELMSASVARIGAPAFSRIYRYDRALRRKLTPAGWLLAALAVAGAVFGLSIGLLAMALLASMRFGIRAKITRALPQVATAGEPFEYSVTVTNLDQRSYEPVIVEVSLDGRGPTAKEFVAFKVREDRTRNMFDRL